MNKTELEEEVLRLRLILAKAYYWVGVRVKSPLPPDYREVMREATLQNTALKEGDLQ